MVHMVSHELFYILFFFSSPGIAKEFSKIDRIAIDNILINVHKFGALIEVKEFLFRKKID